jgi:hypothetical protein
VPDVVQVPDEFADNVLICPFQIRPDPESDADGAGQPGSARGSVEYADART